MTKTNENVIAKIQKLLNLQEGAKAVGNLAEAENAAMRVQEFLLKHNLSLDEVKESQIEAKAKMVMEDFDLDAHQGKSDANWVHSLITVIANYSLCRAIKLSETVGARHNYDQGFVKILGETNNVAIVKFTVEQLISKIHIAEKLAWKVYIGPEKRNTFKRGFLVGAVVGIKSKLREQESQLTSTNTQMGLMVINKKDAVNKFYADQFPGARVRGNKQLMSRDGKNQGYAAGYNMNINKGVGGNSSKGYLS